MAAPKQLTSTPTAPSQIKNEVEDFLQSQPPINLNSQPISSQPSSLQQNDTFSGSSSGSSGEEGDSESNSEDEEGTSDSFTSSSDHEDIQPGGNQIVSEELVTSLDINKDQGIDKSQHSPSGEGLKDDAQAGGSDESKLCCIRGCTRVHSNHIYTELAGKLKSGKHSLKMCRGHYIEGLGQCCVKGCTNKASNRNWNSKSSYPLKEEFAKSKKKKICMEHWNKIANEKTQIEKSKKKTRDDKKKKDKRKKKDRKRKRDSKSLGSSGSRNTKRRRKSRDDEQGFANETITYIDSVLLPQTSGKRNGNHSQNSTNKSSAQSGSDTESSSESISEDEEEIAGGVQNSGVVNSGRIQRKPELIQPSGQIHSSGDLFHTQPGAKIEGEEDHMEEDEEELNENNVDRSQITIDGVKRELEQLRNDMEKQNLEIKVEIRESFARLQTEIRDLLKTQLDQTHQRETLILQKIK